MDGCHQNLKRKGETLAIVHLKSEWVPKPIDRASQCFMSSRVMPFCALVGHTSCFAVMLGFVLVSLLYFAGLQHDPCPCRAESVHDDDESSVQWTKKAVAARRNANGFAHEMDDRI